MSKPDKPQRKLVSGDASQHASLSTQGNLAIAPDHPRVERRQKVRVRQTVSPRGPARLADYEGLVGKVEIDELRWLARSLRGASIRMVNSPALLKNSDEPVSRLAPLLQELELAPITDTLEGGPEFVAAAKCLDRELPGVGDDFSQVMREQLLTSSRRSYGEDFVVVHGTAPVALAEARTAGRQHWIWRCHLDLSRANPNVWAWLRPIIERYDAALFSSQRFAPQLSIPQYLFYPCIDPFSERNRPLDPSYIQQTCDRFGIDRSRPVVTHIAAPDEDQDVAGVIEAYRLAKKYVDCQLVIAGTDVSRQVASGQVHNAGKTDADIIVANLPASADLTINALQRASDLVIEKPLQGGSSAGAAEALWKAKPTIASGVGAIPNQIIHKITGVLIHSVEGCAYQIRFLLTHPEIAEQLGRNGREHVKENFLMTSDLKRWLLLFHILSAHSQARKSARC